MIQSSLPTRRFARLATAFAGRSHRALARARSHAADERGLGLVELVVTMAIMSIVGGALTSAIVSGTKAEVRTNRSVQAQQQSSLALNKLRRELHCASSVTVVNASAVTVAAGTAGNGIRATLGGYCPTNGLTTTSTASVYVTWCTKASTLKTGAYALYRLASLSSFQTCATSGAKWTDYMTTATPFCLPSTIAACGGIYRSATSLSTLHVTLPVNLNGSSTASENFNLVDDIALRNSPRA